MHRIMATKKRMTQTSTKASPVASSRKQSTLQEHPEEYGEAEANLFSQYAFVNYNLVLS